MKVFLNLVPRDYSKCIHMHTHTDRHMHTHTEAPAHKHSDHTKLKYTTQNEQQMPGRPGMDEDSSTEQKTWHVYSLGKEMLLD